MAKTRTKATTTAASILGGLGSQKTTKTTSSTPIIKITNEEQSAQVAAIVKAKKAFSEAKSAVEVACGDLHAAARLMWEKRCQEETTLHTSIKLVTLDNNSIRYTQNRRCKKMLERDTSDTLHRIFDEDFDDNFEIVKPLEIACDKLNDEQIIAVVETLQSVLPEDTFAEVVDYTPQIKAKEPFFSRRINDSSIKAKSRQAESEGVAVLTAAYFKL